jgi:DNA-binding transcriptional regulator GbsR (MarR family)
MSDIKKEKEELVEMFGVHFESHHNLSPLSSRILATLILDGCKNGLTFEDLTERMGASKSSISTNLNLLLKTGKINYYTVAGDRKKYFKPSPFSERLDNYLKIIAYEKQIIDKMIIYRQKTMSNVEEQVNFINISAYKDHIAEIEQLFLKTIDKFKEIEKIREIEKNKITNINPA